jgi:hypothetical protein
VEEDKIQHIIKKKIDEIIGSNKKGRNLLDELQNTGKFQFSTSKISQIKLQIYWMKIHLQRNSLNKNLLRKLNQLNHQFCYSQMYSNFYFNLIG